MKSKLLNLANTYNKDGSSLEEGDTQPNYLVLDAFHGATATFSRIRDIIQKEDALKEVKDFVLKQK